MTGRLPRNLRRRVAVEKSQATDHQPYWNDVLYGDYCLGCGDEWPCLPWRQAQPPKCRCSHTRSLHTRKGGQCWSPVCGCATYRPQETSA